MAKGIGGSYGARTEDHPGRSGAPQSEQPGRGIFAHGEGDYHQIGDTDNSVAPGGLMTVGTMTQQQAATRHPPQSEQPGRGVMVPSWEESFLAENSPQLAGGAYPPQMTDLINNSQFTPS